MKRIAVFLFSIFFLVSNVFANDYGSYEILDVNTDNIYDIFDQMEDGENYAINFSENFDFSKLDKEFFQYRMIEKLHSLCIAGSFLKFTGPFDYIYFDGYQSVNNFSVIKTQIVEHPEKYYCVDISESYYDKDVYGDFIPLPVNCFAGHENLYWVYLGKFLNEDIPAGVCSNLPNLQAVFFWNEGKIDSTAFNNSNPEALYVCGDCGYVTSLSSYVSSSEAANDYDYLKFTSAYEYDPYSGVSWLVDGEEDCYYGWWEDEDVAVIQPEEKSSKEYESEDYNQFPLVDYEDEDEDDEVSDEDYILFINLLTDDVAQGISWDKFGDSIVITKKTKVEKNPVEVKDIATAVLVSLLKGDDNYKKYSILQDDGSVEEEGFQIGIHNFADYGKLDKVLLLIEMSAGEEYNEQFTYAVAVEYSKDDEIKKDISLLVFQKMDEGYKLTSILNGMFRVMLFQSLYN